MARTVVAYFINKEKFKELKIRSNYFLIMIFESIIWSMLLFAILSKGQLLLAKGTAKLLLQQIVLSIGSGIFEEFVFRVILVSGLALIVGLFVKSHYWYKMLISIVIAAVIFSVGVRTPILPMIRQFFSLPSCCCVCCQLCCR